MATFITTIRFTEKGIQAIGDSPKRAAAFKAAAKKLGVKVADIYWTLGPFDGVLIFEAPDDATATAAMLQLSSQGNVHTSTARAFGSAEMEKVVGMLAKKK
ncbi:MAG: GYD domain-containing protein [Pirellulales bacterium]